MTVVWAALASTRLDTSAGATQPTTSASLIKLPLAVAVLTSGLSLDAELAIADHHRVGGTGWLAGSDRTSADVASLLTAMIDASDNTATNVLIDAVGFDAVAAVCATAGLTATVLARHMMDLDARAAGRENTTSALDMVRLLDALPRLLAPRAYDLLIGAMRGQTIDGCLVAACPPGHELAHKTGSLDGFEHDAGLLLRDGRVVGAVAVLGSCPPGQEPAMAHALAAAARRAVAAALVELDSAT